MLTPSGLAPPSRVQNPAGHLLGGTKDWRNLEGVLGEGAGTPGPRQCPSGKASLFASVPPKLETSVKGLQGKMGRSVVKMSEKLKQMQSSLLNPLFPPKHLKNKLCVCSVLSNSPSVFITLSHFSLTSTHTHSCLSDFLCTQTSFTEKLARNSPSLIHILPLLLLQPQAFD